MTIKSFFVDENAAKVTVKLAQTFSVDVYTQSTYNDVIVLTETVIDWFGQFCTITSSGVSDIITFDNGQVSFEFLDGKLFRSFLEYIEFEGDPSKYSYKLQQLNYEQ